MTLDKIILESLKREPENWHFDGSRFLINGQCKLVLNFDNVWCYCIAGKNGITIGQVKLKTLTQVKIRWFSRGRVKID